VEDADGAADSVGGAGVGLPEGCEGSGAAAGGSDDTAGAVAGVGPGGAGGGSGGDGGGSGGAGGGSGGDGGGSGGDGSGSGDAGGGSSGSGGSGVAARKGAERTGRRTLVVFRVTEVRRRRDCTLRETERAALCAEPTVGTS